MDPDIFKSQLLYCQSDSSWQSFKKLHSQRIFQSLDYLADTGLCRIQIFSASLNEPVCAHTTKYCNCFKSIKILSLFLFLSAINPFFYFEFYLHTFCEMMVRRIKSVIDRPFDIEGRLLSVDTSCGYAIYPEHSQKIDEIRIMADNRMYEDKTQNRKKGNGG